MHTHLRRLATTVVITAAMFGLATAGVANAKPKETVTICTGEYVWGVFWPTECWSWDQ